MNRYRDEEEEEDSKKKGRREEDEEEDEDDRGEDGEGGDEPDDDDDDGKELKKAIGMVNIDELVGKYSEMVEEQIQKAFEPLAEALENLAAAVEAVPEANRMAIKKAFTPLMSHIDDRFDDTELNVVGLTKALEGASLSKAIVDDDAAKATPAKKTVSETVLNKAVDDKAPDTNEPLTEAEKAKLAKLVKSLDEKNPNHPAGYAVADAISHGTAHRGYIAKLEKALAE